MRDTGIRLKENSVKYVYHHKTYFRHIVDPKSPGKNPIKVKTIVDFLAPEDTKKLNFFLKMAHYFKIFIKSILIIAAHFIPQKRKDKTFVWGAIQQPAFESRKQAIAWEINLAYCDNKKFFSVF